jgi:hypothetical protein
MRRPSKKNTAGPRKKNGATAPVLRLRQLAIGILCVTVLIVWPMFMVWKQICLTTISVRDSALTDSLSSLLKESAALRLYNERLAGTQRIESICRESLGLDYPTSRQIVVVRETGAAGGNGRRGVLDFTIFHKPYSHERG